MQRKSKLIILLLAVKYPGKKIIVWYCLPAAPASLVISIPIAMYMIASQSFIAEVTQQWVNMFNNSVEAVPENTLGSRPLTLKIAEILILLVVNILSLGGNVLVCITVYRRSVLRTITNMFIVSICVTDILLASVAMPLTLGSLTVDYWPFGELVCQIQGFSIHLLVFQSLQIITLTATNRNLSVVRPWLYKRIFSKRNTLIIIFAVSILTAVIMGALVVSLSSRYVFHPGKVICVMTFPTINYSLQFTVVFSLLFVVFPSIIIFGCYLRVLRTIRRHRRQYDSSRGEHDSKSILSREEVKISKIVFIIILGFLFCWLPCVIIDIIDSTRARWLPRQVYMFYTFLAYTSAVLNPWIYGFMNKLVRREICSLITICRSCFWLASFLIVEIVLIRSENNIYKLCNNVNIPLR